MLFLFLFMFYLYDCKKIIPTTFVTFFPKINNPENIIQIAFVLEKPHPLISYSKSRFPLYNPNIENYYENKTKIFQDFLQPNDNKYQYMFVYVYSNNDVCYKYLDRVYKDKNDYNLLRLYESFSFPFLSKIKLNAFVLVESNCPEEKQHQIKILNWINNNCNID
jgi:hypothetical protein